jgi:hypothetical protein
VIIIWGTRNAGKVDHRDGQYALTRFAHVYWIPLFPVSAMWVTRDGMGHAMKLSGKSVLAGYARTWGVLLGVLGVFGVAGGAGFAAAIAGVSLAALSWAWKDLGGDAAQRRSDLNARSFGTRCEPKLLPDELRAGLEVELKQRWALLSDGQSPSDIARFGTDDVARASAAYGVLRLSAVTLPSAQAAEAERDATRIADGIREKLQLDDGGPYRSTAIDDRLQPEQVAKR